MTCYLLDTNILIAAANDTSSILNSHLAKHANDELFTSSLSWMEIYHRILRINPEGVMTHKAKMYLTVFEKLESSILIEPFTKEDAEAAAKLYDHSRRIGRTLSFQDALIAGQALSRDFVLVSGDRRAGFELYADMGLKYENWLDPLSQTPPSTLLNDLL